MADFNKKIKEKSKKKSLFLSLPLDKTNKMDYYMATKNHIRRF